MKDPNLYRFCRPIFYAIMMSYFNPTIVNKEYIPDKGKIIIAGNHKNALDPILVDVCTKRTIYTLAKQALIDGNYGWFFKGVGSIPVNHNALGTAIDYLNQGCAINLSPEGTRNKTNEILLPFKYGAVKMAKETGSKIIPYSITGDYVFNSKNLKIEFGEPLDVTNASLEEANEELYQNVKKLILKNR